MFFGKYHGENIKGIECILDNIGILEADLRKRVDDAFRGDKSDIRAVGDYGVHVPQDIFKAYLCDFDRLVEKLKERFTK